MPGWDFLSFVGFSEAFVGNGASKQNNFKPTSFVLATSSNLDLA